jgi:hypothetical protein
MTTSSQQQNSSDDSLTDSIITFSGTDTCTITGPSNYSFTYDTASMSTITLTPIMSTYSGGVGPTGLPSTVSIDTFSIYPVEWETCFPDWNRIQNMCKEYPGLAIAFDKFQTTYKLVRDDYDTPKNKRPKP